MRIEWDSLDEIHDYMHRFGLRKICEKESEWGGHGLIITSGGGYGFEKAVSLPGESQAFRDYGSHRDYLIRTPYARELGWLYRSFLSFLEKRKTGIGLFNEAFYCASLGYFISHTKSYPAIRLLDFVFDFVADIYQKKPEDALEEEKP